MVSQNVQSSGEENPIANANWEPSALMHESHLNGKLPRPRFPSSGGQNRSHADSCPVRQQTRWSHLRHSSLAVHIEQLPEIRFGERTTVTAPIARPERTCQRSRSKDNANPKRQHIRMLRNQKHFQVAQSNRAKSASPVRRESRFSFFICPPVMSFRAQFVPQPVVEPFERTFGWSGTFATKIEPQVARPEVWPPGSRVGAPIKCSCFQQGCQPK